MIIAPPFAAFSQRQPPCSATTPVAQGSIDGADELLASQMSLKTTRCVEAMLLAAATSTAAARADGTNQSAGLASTSPSFSRRGCDSSDTRALPAAPMTSMAASGPATLRSVRGTRTCGSTKPLM